MQETCQELYLSENSLTCLNWHQACMTEYIRVALQHLAAPGRRHRRAGQMITGSARGRAVARRFVYLPVAVAASAMVVSGNESTAHAAGPRAALDCTQGSLSKSQAIDQLHQVRDSIDRSLRLLSDGRRDEAFTEAKTGYLQCFESVEAPLDVVAGLDFRFKVENAFARVRGLIDSGASTGEVRDRVVILRGLIDESERRLTTRGIGAPLLVFGQSFSLLLREGLEAVLLLAALFGYLHTTEQGDKYRRTILYGVLAAILATIVAYFAVDAIFASLPFGREVLEAVVGLFAVVVLFYVSFWLAARLEQRRWLEFLRARVWKAVSIGSTTSLALIGFTSVFREGFETVLFYQAMVSSVALVGNAMRALQEAAVINVHFLPGWPNLPIFLAQATGYYPTLPSVVAQIILTMIYIVGGVYTFVIAPRRRRRLQLASA